MKLNEEKKDVKKQEETSFVKEVFEMVEMLVIAACIVLSMYSFVFRLCRVSGPSMDQSLADGQMLIVSNINYTPERGDIVIFHQTSGNAYGYNEPIVKRVIAKAGETIDIDFRTWTVTITDKDGNTQVLDESEYRYLDVGHATLGSDYDFPIEVPEGYLFVMGDNRNHSADSRSSLIGLVDERRVVGKAILRLTPLDKFGKLD